MGQPIRLLMVEDSEDDAELSLISLKQAGFDVQHKRVDNAEDMRRALSSDWDLVLSDYSLPQFNGSKALILLKETRPEIPFIFVSATIGEDVAIESLKAGADDYVMKGNLKRLVPSIRRVLREVEERKKRRQAELDLQDSETRLRLATEASALGIWEWDLKTNEVWRTPLHDRVYGYDKSVAKWDLNRFFEHVHPEDRDMVREKLDKAIIDKSQFMFEFRVVWPDKTVRWVASRGQVKVLEDGKPRSVLGVVFDMTAQKTFQEELVAAKEIAEAASQAKSQFLANMSHEIRTPLGIMLGFADLMRDPAMDMAERLKLIEIIHRNGTDLLKLVNDILDLSKVEAGRLDVEEVSLSVGGLLTEVTTLLSVKAAEKNIAVKSNIQKNVPDQVFSDPARIRQILVNIIGNAIKFTDKGAVEIQVENRPAMDPDMVDLVFVVKDSGVGMSGEQQKRIFQRFSQVDESMTRKFGGAGLGLILSRRLARFLGGDVSLESSAVGKGSTFVIRIPVKTAVPQQ